MKKTLVITAIVVVILVAIFSPGGKGIVALENWEHGVAFCGKEYGVVLYPVEDAPFYNKEHNITYVVNKGHLNDLQRIDLEILAIEECGKLNQE